MLINKQTQLSEDKIFGFKLLSGEEIIGRVGSISDTDVTVHAPHQLAANEQGVGLAPFIGMIHDDADPVFLRTNILAIFEPNTQFVKAYESATSVILTPSSQIAT